MSRIARFALALLAFIAPALAHAVTASQTGTVLSITVGNSETATISHSAGNVLVKNGVTAVFQAPAAGISSVTVTTSFGNTTVTFTDGFDAPLGMTVTNVWFANFTGAFNVDTGGISAASLVGMTLDNAQFTSSTGTINITGNTGSGAGGPGLDGLLINASSITSTSGNILLRGTATGGSGTKSGIHIASSQVSTSGAGTISLTGTGNRTGSDTGSSYGILVDGATSTVSTVNGTLQLGGTAGTGSADGNTGIAIHDGAQVSASGALVSVAATGGGSGASANNHGIEISGAPAASVASLQSGNNVIFIQGAAGIGASSSGISVGSTGFGTIKTADGVNMFADSIDLAAGATVDAGLHGIVLLAPKTATVAIDLGGVDAPGTLGLTNVELNRIIAVAIDIGQAGQSGPITVSAPISLATASLELETSGTLNGPGPVSTPRLTLFEVPSGTTNRNYVVSAGTVTVDSGTPLNFVTPALSFDGGGGNDAYTVTPFAGTAIGIFAGNPTTFPGDSLTIVPGAANPSLISTPSASGYSGTMTFSNAGTITFNGIETGTVALAALNVTIPSTAQVGVPVNMAIAAVDALGTVASSYTGTVHFTSSDPSVILPADTKLVNGIGTFQVTFTQLGNPTVTATDTATSTLNGFASTTVGPGDATHFAVTAPAGTSAGAPLTFSVTALDASNNVATGYTGTMHFTSTDALAILPANSTLTAGTGTFSAMLKISGTQAITATDTVSSISGTASINVMPTAAIAFTVSAPSTATAGTASSFTVTATDQFNNIAAGYSGTVHFTSTDSAGTLPANAILTNGTGTFSATLKTAGSQSMSATDTVASSITGTSGSITVNAGAATHLAVTAPATTTPGSAISVTVTAQDTFNNTAIAYAGTVHFTSGDATAVLPANATILMGTGAFGVTLSTSGPQTITATDTVSASITGSANVGVVVNSYSGPSATGTGTITASFTGGGATCTFAAPQFIGAPPGSPPVPPTLPQAGIRFPQGMFDFSLIGCTPGSTITMTITYPSSVNGMRYWKYGPEASNPSPHWYVMPTSFSGNTVVFSITDGAQGDDDLTANGVIDDQGGPGFGINLPVPTMSWWMMVLTALGLLAIGWRASDGARATRSEG